MNDVIVGEMFDMQDTLRHTSFIDTDGTEQTMFAYKGAPKHLNFYLETQVMKQRDRVFVRVYHKIKGEFQLIDTTKLKNNNGGLKPGQMLLLELDPSYELKVTIEQYKGKFRRFLFEVEEER